MSWYVIMTCILSFWVGTVVGAVVTIAIKPRKSDENKDQWKQC